MKIIFLALILLNINEKVLIECSCIANNLSTSNLNEPIVGSTFIATYSFICLTGTIVNNAVAEINYCIRTIDDTGNYSPYIHYKQDENSLFEIKEEEKLTVANPRISLRNVKNNLYLAILSNGFVYYSPTKDLYSLWNIEDLSKSHHKYGNYIRNYNTKGILYSNNYFNLYSNGGESTFDITKLFDYTSDVKICLNEYQEYCIRTKDNTGSYSPYLSPIKDENIYFKLTSYAVGSYYYNFYTLRNKINNLYLASLPNGFIYYSPSIEPNSQWTFSNTVKGFLETEIQIQNYGNKFNLSTNNLYTLEASSLSYLNKNKFIIIRK